MKNKKVLIFLFIGLAIMGVMLYFIGIDEVIEALKLSNLWLVLLAIVIQIFTYFLQQDCGYGFGNKKITSYGFS